MSYGGVYYATVFRAGKYAVNKETSIEVSQAGIFMFSSKNGRWSVIAHDPTKSIDNTLMESKIKIKIK